ncbi:hypothetical protein JCM11641_000418 [Rhodosporidiobolus odoratus]
MRTTVIAASFASLAGLAAAQSGYGRFGCTAVGADNTFSADQSLCADDALVNPGNGDATSNSQGDHPNPTNSVCTMETTTGAYFCGIAGAACTTNDNCDNGQCIFGVCKGGFTEHCSGTDANCLGFLYCTDVSGGVTTENTCGGLGSYCQDYTQGDQSLSAMDNYQIFNQFCASGYCNYGTALCDIHATVGMDCSSDPDFQCGTDLTCDQSSYTCVAAPVASGYARARRNADLTRRSLCPASTSACKVEGSLTGFECIDVQTNLEQCGGCASAGGVDCTAMEGVSGVGCVAGVCEIWSCAEGYTWDSEKESCLA